MLRMVSAKKRQLALERLRPMRRKGRPTEAQQMLLEVARGRLAAARSLHSEAVVAAVWLAVSGRAAAPRSGYGRQQQL